ncbi:hypothetical protein EDD37DRAFT_333373 [Exophiala viscosa]|uniref:uncharacterized protein n=1 Tax=Exophiala viscosa TaxID=2486360 RepID=UPI00218F4C48|nr:hypothetical protein EDD37DRAFT_333373 [Exophiala viscosa]
MFRSLGWRGIDGHPAGRHRLPCVSLYSLLIERGKPRIHQAPTIFDQTTKNNCNCLLSRQKQRRQAFLLLHGVWHREHVGRYLTAVEPGFMKGPHCQRFSKAGFGMLAQIGRSMMQHFAFAPRLYARGLRCQIPCWSKRSSFFLEFSRFSRPRYETETTMMDCQGRRQEFASLSAATLVASALEHVCYIHCYVRMVNDASPWTILFPGVPETGYVDDYLHCHGPLREEVVRIILTTEEMQTIFVTSRSVRSIGGTPKVNGC